MVPPEIEKPLRVCVVTTTFPSPQRPEDPPFVLHLSRALAARGHALTVLTQAIRTETTVDHFENLEVERFSYFRPYSSQRLHGGLPSAVRGSLLAKLQVFFLAFSMFLRLRARIRTGAYDLIHAHWAFPSGWIAGHVGRRSKVPVVLTVHGSDVFTAAPLLRWFSRRALAMASIVTANSQATLEKARELQPGVRAEVIGMPVAVPSWSDVLQQERDEDLVIAVGRLVAVKGHRYLVDAFQEVLQHIPRARLKIIGGGPEEEDLRLQIDRLFPRREVELLGPLPHSKVLAWIRRAKVLVQPSIEDPGGAREGLGVAILEAMAHGTTVVASRSGGIAEAVREAETGLLVRPGDSGELASRLLEVLSGGSGNGWTKNAYEEVRRRYGVETVSARFEGCFRKALDSP